MIRRSLQPIAADLSDARRAPAAKLWPKHGSTLAKVSRLRLHRGPRSPVAASIQTRRNAPARPLAAFSLIEVVAAVGIFAIGMIAVLGLFAPVTKSVANVAEAEAAARVADALRARLRALPFDSALALVQDPAAVVKKDAEGNYNPNDGTKNPAVMFGKRSGDIGIYNPDDGKKAWFDSSVPTPRRVLDADKFFEIDLIRNETLSPKENDATAALVAFAIRVRWPAFAMTSANTAVQTGQGTGGPVPFDHGRKQVLFFTGTISR